MGAGKGMTPEPDGGGHAEHGRARRSVRVAALGLVLLLAFAVVPAAVLAVGSAGFDRSRYAPPPPSGPVPASTMGAPRPPHDPGKPTAVVLVGNHGANVADALVPFDILATTGAFNVYTVAPERRPVPLLGGLDLVPDLSLAELSATLGGAAPDVTVVPEMPDTDPGTGADDAPVTGWLRDVAGEGLVLGVCTGARVVAEAGLVDGRPATSHWYRLAGLEEDHPSVRWQRGLRYVDDGDVITTGGLLSSVDGTLRVVERMAGPATAAAAAADVGWQHYSPGVPATLPPNAVTPTNGAVHVLNLGFRSGTTTMGVLLTNGVGELELASAFDPYAEGKVARTLSLAADPRGVRSRHGLTFVPRAGLDAVGGTDRLLVPGSGGGAEVTAALTAAGSVGIPAARLHPRPGFAFDGALQDMALATDVPTARWTAKILEYPAEDLRVTGRSWPWGPTLAALTLGLAGLAVALAAIVLVRRRSASRAG
jgi:putative intracellular protease/amidase